MIKTINKFDYKNLSSHKKGSKRFYDVDGLELPSVTTILSETADKTFLYEWRKRVGTEEANKITKRSSDAGTEFHNMLEEYIKTGTKKKGKPLPTMMFEKVVKEGLVNLDEAWGSEVGLFYPGVYAGTVDLVGVHNGDDAIIDFKNSRKEKRIEWIEDYTCQLAAYALAHNAMYGTNIQKGVIMLATHDGRYQEFVFEGNDFTEAEDLWLARVAKYFEMTENIIL